MQGIDYALSVICLGCPSNVFRVGMNFNMQHKHIFRDYLVSWKQIIIFKLSSTRLEAPSWVPLPSIQLIHIWTVEYKVKDIWGDGGHQEAKTSTKII